MTWISNVNTKTVSKVTSWAQEIGVKYPYPLSYKAANYKVIEALGWLRDNKINFHWSGAFSTYPEAKYHLAELYLRFITEEDLMAFKLAWT